MTVGTMRALAARRMILGAKPFGALDPVRRDALFVSMDVHRHMYEVAAEVEDLGHPADADRVYAIADKLLREAAR